MPSSNKNYHTTTSPGLKPTSAVQARHHSYHLLSRLYLNGLGPDQLALVQAVPELADHLPDPFDLDEMAAAHYQLFGFNVFPFESIFLDDSGLSGGPITGEVARVYQGIRFVDDSDSPDHIGQEMACLAYLCRLELAAWQNDSSDVNGVRRRQIEFLQAHLLRWLPPLVLAVIQQDDSFFTAVARISLALAADHYRDLASESDPHLKQWTLPTPPPLLKQDKTGIKEVAAYLTTPATSGIYLGRDDVGRLARRLDLPRGFGDRQQLLTNLMHTAVQYDHFPDLLLAVKDIVAEWQAGYQRQSDQMPQLSPFLSPWRQRANQTGQLIDQMLLQLEENV